jgi:hypothetical protein
MNYVILEKAKPYTRTKRGKLERVKGYAGKPIQVFHGTSKTRLRSILKEGLRAGRFRNWDLSFYKGKRKGMVYVTKDLDDAIYFARETENKMPLPIPSISKMKQLISESITLDTFASCESGCL